MVRVGLKSVLIGVVLAAGLMPAGAIEDFDRGKTGKQLFDTNCALCHNAVRGLAKDMTTYGLTRYLREHYTTEEGQASLLAGYLMRAGAGAGARAPRERVKRKKDKSEQPTRDPEGKAASGEPAAKPDKPVRAEKRVNSVEAAKPSTDGKDKSKN